MLISKKELIILIRESSKESSKESGHSYVYIADSQGESGIGKAIKKRLGPANRDENYFQKSGATAEKIRNLYGDKIKSAVKNTYNIIITLGGNGSSMASYLAKDILENAPEDAKITWILAPPNNRPNNKKIYDPKFSKGKWGIPFENAIKDEFINKKKKLRKKYNEQIIYGINAVEKMLNMKGRINIIDPFPWFESNITSSRDGVHVDDNPGESYIATINSELYN